MSSAEKLSELAAEPEVLSKKAYPKWGALVLWFIVIAVIVWLLLYALRPSWVQKKNPDGQPNGEIDAGRVLLATVIIALVVVIIVWLIRSTCVRP